MNARSEEFGVERLVASDAYVALSGGPGTLGEVAQRAVEHVERFKIQNALREVKWNKTRAAEVLGVSYKTLLQKIRALGLDN
jgi:DNA-binding NtrC family response regulator